MLKRLLVLVAALAALLVFAPTASAQLPLPEECTGAAANLTACLQELNEPDGGGIPAECQGLTTEARLTECLAELAGTPGLPRACDELVAEFGTTLPTTPGGIEELTENLLACLTALVPAVEPEPEPEPEEPGAADTGYGYDGYGYDIGYDGAIPNGGVPSGFGPTGSDAAGAPLAARGAALLAVLGVLATGLLIMRRRHGS